MTGRHEEGIPDGWVYERLFRWPLIKLPVAWIAEGTATVQCLCPYCPYASGYNETLLLVDLKKRVKKCKTCGTRFIALVS